MADTGALSSRPESFHGQRCTEGCQPDGEAFLSLHTVDCCGGGRVQSQDRAVAAVQTLKDEPMPVPADERRHAPPPLSGAREAGALAQGAASSTGRGRVAPASCR
jgi:hypothetical protein